MNSSTTTPETSPHSDLFDPHHLFAGLASGTARYWKARAEVFEWARPRLDDDFHGCATPEALAAQWDRLTAKANACRARAEVAERFGCTPADMALVVGVAEALVAA